MVMPTLPTSHPHPDLSTNIRTCQPAFVLHLPRTPTTPPSNPVTPTSDPLRHSHRLPHIRPDDRANLHPSDICRHADNQKSGQAAFEGAEGKGKTFPLEMQLYDLMRGATRACAVCERCSELKALEAGRCGAFPTVVS